MWKQARRLRMCLLAATAVVGYVRVTIHVDVSTSNPADDIIDPHYAGGRSAHAEGGLGLGGGHSAAPAAAVGVHGLLRPIFLLLLVTVARRRRAAAEWRVSSTWHPLCPCCASVLVVVLRGRRVTPPIVFDILRIYCGAFSPRDPTPNPSSRRASIPPSPPPIRHNMNTNTTDHRRVG